VPNDASQRTWGKDAGPLINRLIGEKQLIVYVSGSSLFFGKMDPDGTNWVPKKILNIVGSIVFSDIHNDEIYIFFSNTFNTLIKLDTDGNIISTVEMTGINWIPSYSSPIHFDFNVNKIYRSRKDSSNYIWIDSINFSGSGYETHQITARKFYEYFRFRRCGDTFLYFFTAGRLYTATSNLDCTDFIAVNQVIDPPSVGHVVSTTSTALVSFFYGTSFCLGTLDVSGTFSYVPVALTGFIFNDMFIRNSYLYSVTFDDFTNPGYTTYYTGRTDLGGGGLFEKEFTVPSSVASVVVDPDTVNGDIYAWSQVTAYNNETIYLSHLWTYPGNCPITPTTVQCQVTQTLIDPTTGKTITPLIGGV